MTEAIIGSPILATGERAAPVVSWAPVIAGAVVASAFSVALVSLGAGLGLVAVSPWSSGVSVETFGLLAAAWFIAVQLFASGLGGYLAGRLRARRAGAPADEVHFRDTAHGLLVWAVGAAFSALVLAFAASSLIGGAARLGATAAAEGPARQTAEGVADAPAYFTDIMLRTDHAPGAGDAAAPRAEIARILARGLAAGGLPPSDRAYLAEVVAARTGASRPDAEKRVDDVFGQAQSAAAQAAAKTRDAAEAARRTGVDVSLWAFISLLIGAFSASGMAVVGGRARDDIPLGG